MKRAQAVNLAFMLCILSICAGCGKKFLDPTQMGRFRPMPAVNVILDSLGVADEPPLAWENAEEPSPRDIVALESDYVFQAGDVIRISIFELLQEGVPLVNTYIVTESGKVSIPDVGVIQAAGLTETQLEEEIRQILSPSILRDPSVSVALAGSQQRAFSILGNGVPAPSRYLIPRYDFRLTDALATAGGPRQFNVSYIYVSRQEKNSNHISPLTGTKQSKPELMDLEIVEPRVPSVAKSPLEIPEPTSLESESFESAIPEPEGLAQPSGLERETLQMISPIAQLHLPKSKKVVVASTEMTGNKELAKYVVPGSFRRLNDQRTRTSPQRTFSSATELTDRQVLNEQMDEQELDEHIEWIFQDGKWVPVKLEPPKLAEPIITEKERPTEDVGGGIEWIFQDDKWIPVRSGPPLPTEPPTRFEPKEPVIPLENEKLPTEMAWEQAIQARLIRIPTDKLLAGDPRYNIIIKPGDTIYVPVDVIGEFCIMGNVNRSGYINITGRPMTLKMAIAAAGGLGPLAWPKSCEVIRRIGENKEEIVMVDLDRIARGEQPDFFIKPNDLINVGTHATSRWRAVLRNAFRATYGFGFVYDRNFAYADYAYGTSFFW